MRQKNKQRLNDEEILSRLKILLKKNADFNKLIELDSELFSNIYWKKNNRGIKGVKNLYHYLDIIKGNTTDYSALFRKMHRSFWTEDRVTSIMLQFKEEKRKNKKVSFYDEHYALYVYLTKNNLWKYFIDKVDLSYSDLFCKKEQGYWHDFNNLKKEYYKLYKLLNGHPTKMEFIIYGIGEYPLNYHGGIKKIREELGYTLEGNHRFGLDGFKYRSSFEIFVANLLYINGIYYRKDKKVDKKVNYKTDFFLVDFNIDIEIWGYTQNGSKRSQSYHLNKGAKKKYYAKNEINIISIDISEFTHSFEKNIAMIIDKLKLLVDLKILPSDYEELVAYPRYSIKDLGRDLQPYMHNNKYLPSEEELKKAGRTDLIYQIKQFGGILNVAKELNLLPNHKMPKEKKKVWTIEKKEKELLCVIANNKLSYAPTLEKLKTIYNPRLGKAIGKACIYDKLIDKLGLIRERDYYRIINLEKKKEIIIGIFTELQNEFGYVPNTRGIRKSKYSYIINWFKEFGGYLTLSKNSGFVTETEYKRIYKNKHILL